MKLWTVIKKIFSRKQELCFTVFGPSGSGKTSLLACMNYEFAKKGIAGFLTPVPESFITLDLAYRKLEEMGTGGLKTIRVPALVPGTETLRQHGFELRGTEVKFFDFPGAWINPDVSGKEREHYETVQDIVKKSMVIIVAIDTPYLMEAKGKYKEKAKVPEIEHFLQLSLANHDDPRLFLPKLILLVPIKCEKYTRSAEETAKMHDAVKKTFENTVNMVTRNYPDQLALAMLPIHTIGNVDFSHFERDGGMVFTRNKQPFAPRDADQPLRYAISFLLKQRPSWERKSLKGISEVIQEGINVNKSKGFEIIHGREMIGL